MLSTLNGFENLPELIEAVKNGIIPAELFNEMDGDLVNMFTMLANSFRTDNKSDNTHNYSKDLTGLEYLDLNPDLKDMKDLYYKLVSTGYSESQAKAIIKQYALGIESNEMDVKEAVKEIKRMAYVRETTNRAIEDIKQLWNAHGYYGEAAVILNQMNIGAYSEDNMETLLMIKNILSNPAFEIDYEHGDHYVTGGFKIKVSEDWATQLQLDYDAQYAGNVYDEDGNLVNDNGAASLAYFDMLAQIDQAETDAAKYEKYLKQYFGQA